MTKQHYLYRMGVFVAIFGIVGLLTLMVMRPVIGLLSASLVYSIIIWPLYKKLLPKLKYRKRLTSVLTVLSSIIVLVIPALLFAQALVIQVITMLSAARTQYLIESIPQIVEHINTLLSRLPDPFAVSLSSDQLTAIVTQNLQPVGDWILNSFWAVSNFSIGFVMNAILLIILVYFIVPNLPRLKLWLISLSPLSEKATHQYLSRSYAMVIDVLKGTFLIAIVQGLLGGLFLAVIGVPAWVFWTFVMMIFSALPIGAVTILIVIGIYFLLSGNIVLGLATIAWGSLVVGTVDNYLRSILVSKEANVHPAIMMTAVLGGLKAFGFMGLLYGPLIIVLFLTTLSVYKQEYFEGSIEKEEPEE